MTESNDPHKAQLDKAEREQLEDIVTQMRERVEGNVRFQLTQRELDSRPEQIDELDSETEQLVEAIDLEATDGESWSEALDKYVTSVGYTIVNRLTALRCMEVREFIDEEVTVFKQNGLTPAAERLVQEEFLLEDEAILDAYHNACDTFAEEIEILFDRSSAYSLIDPDDDSFEELCEMLDSVPSRIWRADDVLGWVYEYYNVKLLDDLRRKGDREGLDPEDVPPANQFYTPHWVVRMLTDNSLGKLYLEHTGELQDVVEAQKAFSPDERKNRPLSPDESPDISDFCTYLVPSDEGGHPTDFDHPEELRIIDPACGSGHFLLYAFDVLERIWRAETDLNKKDIPQKILQHNIYGVDLDMRACQLAAFNLYLKSRARAESEGEDNFEMPEVGIVCADAKIADIDGVKGVFEQVAGEDPKVEDALDRILDAFENVHGLGSLLDVRGTLGDLFEDESDTEGFQITLSDDPTTDHTLGQVLHSLRVAVDEHQDSDSFLAQDLRSFVRLLDMLAQDYDVSLMNPPYGSRNRMPDSVEEYVESHYEYTPEFYINFFETCDNLTKSSGRIGMLVPRSFMFKGSFEPFRQDFVGKRGAFDFLAEFGIGILDNATVRTVGTVVRSGGSMQGQVGEFYRLQDLDTYQKESGFLKTVSGSGEVSDIKRRYRVSLEDLARVPGTPISYYTPPEVRKLHHSELKLDADVSNISGSSVSDLKTGLQSGNNDRFVRKHWESDQIGTFLPFAKGGADAWVLPQITETVDFHNGSGKTLRRIGSSRFQNSEYYGRDGLTWTYIKETGRRFGYFPPDSVFSNTGFMLFPKQDYSLWTMLGVLNSDLYHSLFLSLTTERHWNVGEVGRVPWQPELLETDEIGNLAKEQYQNILQKSTFEPTSPYYIGPKLLPNNYADGFVYDHSHSVKAREEFSVNFEGANKRKSITDSAKDGEIAETKINRQTEEIAIEIDDLLYEKFDLAAETIDAVRQEIYLRTSEDSQDRQIPDPESVSDVPNNIDNQVKNLIQHFAIEIVRDERDGIIPINSINDQADMLDRIVERFRNAYGEYAEDRISEVDEILGNKSATQDAYPNLRAFVDNELFDYHVSRMENTPIIWKFTTRRLVANSTGEGFACFVDYHSLDSGLLDRLANQYLEPRKAELRERRSAANRRRSNDSLPASEQAEATEQYNRCASGLNQVSVFEDVLQSLGSTSPRAFEREDRQLVEGLATKVDAFHEEVQKRVDTLTQLHEQKSEAWFQDTFSNTFWDTVDNWHKEWIDALEELNRACEEYTKPVDESIEPHLGDLFGYFNRRLKGSDHYSSTGILFMTYYFDREGSDLLDDDGLPLETLTDDERLLASLATGVEDPSVVDEEFLKSKADDDGVEELNELQPLAEFKALAEDIDDRCQIINSRIPSDWSDRALSEITTEGYQPNRDHGVEINIEPLAKAEIVPKTVDEDVL